MTYKIIYLQDVVEKDIPSLGTKEVGDFRVIFRIENDTVTIVKIGHRREVYQN